MGAWNCTRRNAAVKTTIDNLDKAFMEVLNQYKDACHANADEAVTYTAKEAAKELRNANPSGSGKYRSWKEYNKGWTVTQTKRDKREHKSATVHNKDHYQLTHLLEKGHALTQGGRSKAFPHIAPVAEKAEEMLYQRMVKGL